MSDNVAIKLVRISGMTLLKIVTHCQSALPNAGTHGQLLGLDEDDVLDISSCYASIDLSDAPDAQVEEELFNENMLKHLRDVNVDSNNVGWYTSAWWESYNTKETIETQLLFQQDLGRNCVCLAYDPLKTTHGKLWLKAFRLTDKFVEFSKRADFSHESVRAAALATNEIWEEIPIEIYNSSLIKVFLAELALDKRFKDERYSPNSFELDRSSYLVNSLEQMVDNIDDLFQNFQQYAMNSKKANMHNRQMKDEKPSRLPSLLLSRSISNHCDYLSSTGKSTFENLCFAQSTQITNQSP